MPELAILEQSVLTGLIQKYVAPPSNVATNFFRRQSHPFTSAKWDVVGGNRYRGHVTMPNREGKIVGQEGVGQKTASFIYFREKKAFEPTTLRWLREPGQMAANNAEACIRRETQDLNNRLERLVESYCWDALKGTITISEPDVKATISMGIAGTHTPTASVHWDYVDGSGNYTADIIGNLKAWKKLIVQDSGVNPTDIYLSSTVMELVYKNTAIKAMFTDLHKQQYLATGEIMGLLGLNWHIHDDGYVNDSDAFVQHLPDTHVLIKGNAPEAFTLYEGLSADMDAPPTHTGKFSKAWETTDPSAHFVLLEYNFLPILMNPDTVVYAQIT